jgi:hypothetical protein
MKEWLYWHFPIITTRYRISKRIAQVLDNQMESTIRLVRKMNDKSNWAAINPVIHDLESLRADTWNQDKITKIQEWLRDNFEVRDDSHRYNS